jgi:hypothetical protein
MDVFFQDLFPPGFWKTVASTGTFVCFFLALDLLLGARVLNFLGRTMNKKFHVDQIVVRALNELKRKSDTEFDTENGLTRGWGRFALSGVLLVGGTMMLFLLVPRLH